MFIQPPFFSYEIPNLSTPMLSAYLEQNNILTAQIDLNIKLINYYLKPKFFKQIQTSIFKTLTSYTNKDKSIQALIQYILCDFFIHNIEEVINNYRAITAQDKFY